MRKNFMSKSPTLFLALFFLLLLFVLAVSLPASQMTHAQTGDGWMTYEDYDPLLLPGYNGTWSFAVPNTSALGGQMSLTSDAGASVTFQLQVTETTGGYSIRYASGPDGGTFEVRVNNSVRQYSSYSEMEMYNREITDGSLSTGSYTITITNSNGTFWLEAIQVKGLLAGDNPVATPTPRHYHRTSHRLLFQRRHSSPARSLLCIMQRNWWRPLTIFPAVAPPIFTLSQGIIL